MLVLSTDEAVCDQYWAEGMTGFPPDSAVLAHKFEMMPKFDKMAAKRQYGPIEMIDPDVRLYGDVANSDVSREGLPAAIKERRATTVARSR